MKKTSSNLFVVATLMVIASTKGNLEVKEVTSSTAKVSLPFMEEMYGTIRVFDIFENRLLEQYEIESGQTTCKVEFLSNDEEYIIEFWNASKPICSSRIRTAQCPSGWTGYRNSCYHPVAGVQGWSWSDAAVACADLSPSAHLADPRTTQEIEFISSIERKDISYWIGISTEGTTVQYSDGSAVNESVSSLLHGSLDEGCVTLNSDRSLHIRACNVPSGYLCEYPIPQYPRKMTVSTTSTAAEVRWEEAISLHGSLSEYYVVSVATPRDNRTRAIEWKDMELSSRSTSNDTTEMNITGLSAGSLHMLSITTVNTMDGAIVSSSAQPSETPFITNPNSPQNLRVVELNPTEVLLEWEPPDGDDYSSFDSYRITYETNHVSHYDDTSGSNEILIRSLAPASRYFFTVQTLCTYFTPNGVFSSFSHPIPSSVMEIMTPVSPVFDLRLKNGSLHEMEFTIQWSHALGKVDNYMIMVEGENGFERKVDNVTNEYLLDGLTPGKLYSVQVMALTQGKESLPMVLHQRTRPPPVATGHVTSIEPTTNTVKVTILRMIDDTAVYDGYKLVFEGLEAIIWNLPLSADIKHGEADETVVEKLTPGSIYRLKIYTTSGDVLSVPAEVEEDVMMELASPNNFHLISVNETSISLGWEKSEGRVGLYLVTRYGETEGVYDSKLIQHDKKYTVTFNGLIPGAKYAFTIVAQSNEKLQSRASKQVEYATRTMPNMPEDARIDFKNDTAAVISWQTPGNVLSGYEVKYTPRNNTYSTVPTMKGNISIRSDEPASSDRIYATLDFLVPGIIYDMSVLTTSFGILSQAATLHFETDPHPVSNVSVVEIGEYWCYLQWQPGLGGFKSFLVTWEDYDEELESTTALLMSQNISQTHHNFTANLEPAAIYYTTIITETHFQVSSPASIFVRTKPLPVMEVGVDTVTETIVTIGWIPQSRYSSFYLEVFAKDKSDSKMIEFKNITKAYVTFDNLEPGRSYTITIFTVFKMTRSYGVEQNVTTYPKPPVNLVETEVFPDSFSIKWQKPEGFVGSYKVVLISNMHQRNAIVHETIAELKDLTPGVAYLILVYSISQDNLKLSETPAQLQVSTHEEEPGPPKITFLKSEDNTSISIEWSKPSEPNGKILQHEVWHRQIFPHPELPEYVTTNVSYPIMSYRLSGLDPGAVYLVALHARNSAGPGMDAKDTVKVLESIPGVVSNLVVNTLDSNSINVTWGVPDMPNGDIVKYRLMVNDESGNKMMDVDFLKNKSGDPLGCFDGSAYDDELIEYTIRPMYFNATSSQEHLVKDRSFEGMCPIAYQVTELDPYTKYTFTVQAFTAVGGGALGKAIGITLEELPSGPPKDVQMEKVGPVSFSFSWKSPERPNGFLQYTIRLVGKEFSEEKYFYTNLTMFTIEGLRPFHKYAFTLKAGTAAGDSVWHEWMLFNTTEGVPGIPLDLDGRVMSSSSVYLWWKPPHDPHGVLKQYQIIVYDQEREEIFKTEHLALNESDTKASFMSPVIQYAYQHKDIESEYDLSVTFRSTLGDRLVHASNESIKHLVEDLRPYTTYRFSVSAVNMAGVGLPSNFSATTAEDAPGSPPANLQYENLTSTSVNITWSEPVDSNGVIIGYKVMYLYDGDLIKLTVPTTYAVLQNLKKYTLYSVYVESETAKGDGPSSSRLPVHTDEDEPDSPPLNPTYKNLTSSVIEVHWSPPEKPNGVIRFYTVHYRNYTGEYEEQSNTTLTVLQNLRVYGEYLIEISASTKHGDGGHRSRPLYVRTMEGQPETPPFNLTYENLTSSSINLKWNKPLVPNGVILHYEISLAPFGGLFADSANISVKTENSTPQVSVYSLKPYHSYLVSVRAHTKYGTGAQESESIIVYTLEDENAVVVYPMIDSDGIAVPSTPPMNFSYRNTTSTSVQLTWHPPEVANGHITHYTIYYTTHSGKKKNVVEPSETSKTVFDLKPFSIYIVKISASTSVGEGVKATIEVQTEEDEPASPPHSLTYTQLSSTAIMLSWLPPVEPNGIILHYNIMYGNASATLNATSQDSSITLKNLRKYGFYTAYVTASTKYGYGNQKSKELEFKTLQDAPSDPPHNVTARADSATSLEVSWRPPNHPNGLIQYYTVYYEDEDRNNNSKKVTDGTKIFLINLKKYTWYKIYITADTALGNGNQTSKIVRIRTMAGVPDSAVRNLTAIAINSTRIYAYWEHPVPVTGVFYYSVKHSEQTDAGLIFIDEQVIKQNTTAFMDKLTPYTNYKIDVEPKVDDIVGSGPKQSVSVITLEDKPSSPPQNLRAGMITSTSVTLTWKQTPNPNGIILSHSIHIVDTNISVEVPASGNNTYTVKNLQKYAEYVATLSAGTKKGYGPAAIVNFRTLQDVPDDFAYDVKVTVLSSSEARVSWKPPLQPNGVIVSYAIQYSVWQHGNVQNITKIDNTGSNETEYTIKGLKPHTSYSVIIFSSTAAGMGPKHSVPVILTTQEDAPTAPSKLTCLAKDEYTVQLQWSPPVDPNGIITAYRITYGQGESDIPTFEEINASDMQFLTEELAPYTTYAFRVQAVTRAAVGESARCMVKTRQGYANAPSSLRLVGSSASTLTIQWKAPTQMNGILVRYIMFYNPPDSCISNNGSMINEVNEADENMCRVFSTAPAKILISLESYSSYMVSVGAETGGGVGDICNEVSFRTDVGVPTHAPFDIQAQVLSSTSINVSWTQPAAFSGPTTYRVVLRTEQGETILSNAMGLNAVGTVVDDLDEDTDYHVTVAAVTSAGSKESTSVKVRTMEDAPEGPPVQVKISTFPGNSSAVLVHFLPPRDPNGVVIKYKLQYKLVNDEEIVTLEILSKNVPDSMPELENQWWELNNLLGGRKYNFRMNAATSIGAGPWSLWSEPVLLPVTAPPKPRKALQLLKGMAKSATTKSTLQLDVCVFSDVNGPLSKISVIIAEDGANLENSPIDWLNAQKIDPTPPYMVLATDEPSKFCLSLAERKHNRSRKRRSTPETQQGFVVGADKSCEKNKKEHCNGPLKSNTPYRIKLRAEAMTGDATETEYSDPIMTDPTFLEANLILIIAIILAIFVSVMIVSIAVHCLRKRQNKLEENSLDEASQSDVGRSGSKRKLQTSSNSNISLHQNLSFVMEPTDAKGQAPLSRPIMKHRFAEHVARMSQDKCKGFTAELDEIKSVVSVETKDTGSLPCNARKNRYASIIPYDRSRVKIDAVSGMEGSDYINASYIPGPDLPEQYIATQAPLDHTQNDFWRMVWETGAKSIVTLCNIQDEGKDRCSEFWPRTQVEYFGNIAIQSAHEDMQPEWTMRKLDISKRDKRRHITQFQFTMWPVRGVPENPQPFVRFIDTVRANTPVDGHPLIVMCSSGSGRSALYISLNCIMERMKTENQVDPFGVIAELRKYRPYMIQSVAEYSFLHDCLLDLISTKVEKTSVRSPTGDGVEETTMF